MTTPEQDPTDTPPEPVPPSDPVVFAPATWYAISTTDDNPDCTNYTKVFDEPEFYSNAGTGTCFVQCGKCGHRMRILTGTVLDPQPVMT
jgi:hypothetical protein